jgi:eukaryotic-like serine/threonine-protein kinase
MPVAIGSVLSQYEITALLGQGGMGTVYRARDKKLKRDVAIKILPDEFAKDPGRLGRFQREAEALASLSHVNIAAIYDLQESSASTFLVLELVEGETLEELLKRRTALPADEALLKARQICAALEAAHDRGIVHRDLKPANIKIAADGMVKLLDFGLARFRDEGDLRQAGMATQSMHLTEAGKVMGTPTYMPPEQVRGDVVDARADIWAFGCVLFEMLTGDAPFVARTVADTFGLILSSDPNWLSLPAETPAGIRTLLRLCLQKDRTQRLSNIADARVLIDDALVHQDDIAPLAVPRTGWRQHVMSGGWIVAALAITGLAIVVAGNWRRPIEPPLRAHINTPAASDGFSLVLSPDGRRLVYPVAHEGRTQLWIRPLDSLSATVVAGSDGASFPFWSPDGKSVGFFADGQLKRADVNGGVPVVLARAALGRGATWNKNDVIVFAPSGTGPLMRVSSSGGDPVAATQVEAGHMSHRFPQFLPDGEHFIFFAAGSSPGVFAASLSGGPATRVVSTEASAVVTADGSLYFIREGALFVQPFDLAKLQLRGQPEPVAEQVAVDSGAFLGGFTAAPGVVAYRTGGAGGRRQLTWFDRSGKTVDTVGAPDTAVLTGTELSPDMHRVAVNRMLNGNLDIWLIDVTKGALSRITFDPTLDAWPHWTADGSRIVYSSNVKGTYNLYDRPSSGGGTERLLLESDQAKIPQDVSSDGRLLVYASLDTQTGFDLWTLPMSGSPTPQVFLKTPFQESGAQVSPDGHWVAYHSNESGRYEVYVQPLNGQPGRIQVSTGGGAQPRWRRDQREIFYVSLDSRIMAAPIDAARAPLLDFGDPAPLFNVDITGGPILLNNSQQYWASPDGQRFLVNVSIDPTPPITLLYNWTPGVPR